MQPTTPTPSSEGSVGLDAEANGTLVVKLAGAWHLEGSRPAMDPFERRLREASPTGLRFDATTLGDWDTSLVAWVARALELATQRQLDVDREGLPPGVRRLLALSEAVPEKQGARVAIGRPSILLRIGSSTIAATQGAAEIVDFLGQVTLAVGRMLTFRARFQRSDLFLVIQECGVQALPIVTLISFLVGLILAFVGSVQLQQFGATIYVANLVGLAMAREMGAMMTAIIMAGRTGAAFAARLGTMKVTEEIDALTTMGISPLEFLVLPRMLALSLMMPLLCLYSNLVGLIGGLCVAIGMLDINLSLYIQQTLGAVSLTDFATGLFKSAVFGVLIAIAGCLRGMQCGNSASAVGDATTSAVVSSIVLIVVADGGFAVLFNLLHI
jgi:phospholipid/cholesterol/gamma-HCH transport system permease protein